MGFSLPDERRKIFRKGKKLEVHVRSLNVTSEPATYSYTPYGVTTTSTSVSGSDRLNPFKYTSRQELVAGGDSGTRPNLYHYRSRAYLPEIARFAQVDSFPGFLTRPASLNKYMYVEGGPVVRVDPRGDIFLELLVGAVAVGAVAWAIYRWTHSPGSGTYNPPVATPTPANTQQPTATSTPNEAEAYRPTVEHQATATAQAGGSIRYDPRYPGGVNPFDYSYNRFSDPRPHRNYEPELKDLRLAHFANAKEIRNYLPQITYPRPIPTRDIWPLKNQNNLNSTNKI